MAGEGRRDEGAAGRGCEVDEITSPYPRRSYREPPLSVRLAAGFVFAIYGILFAYGAVFIVAWIVSPFGATIPFRVVAGFGAAIGGAAGFWRGLKVSVPSIRTTLGLGLLCGAAFAVVAEAIFAEGYPDLYLFIGAIFLGGATEYAAEIIRTYNKSQIPHP